MTQLHTDLANVQKVWNWCREAFLKNGRRLSLPKNTDPQKTYQWRYATRLADQLEEWEFDDQTSKMFIDVAVSYAKRNHLLNKGLSAFFQSNMLQICYDHIEDHDDMTKSRIIRLSESVKYVNVRRSGRSYLETLLDNDKHVHANIIEWYDIKKITTLYLALSQSCTVALSRLKRDNPGHRELLPCTAELLCLRTDVSDDIDLKRKSALVLGNDWRKLCIR